VNYAYNFKRHTNDQATHEEIFNIIIHTVYANQNSIQIPSHPNQNSYNQENNHRAVGVSQAVQHLPSQCEALSSNQYYKTHTHTHTHTHSHTD
jgi:hypothetical protein